MPDLLCISSLSAGYGAAAILHDVSFTLREGRSLALLGRNGVGKTTLINSIVGITRRTAGDISLGGIALTRLSPERRARAGIGWVPQERNIFKSLTVLENLIAVALPGPWTPERVFAMSRAWPSASAISATNCRAASSRCWRSAARSC